MRAALRWALGGFLVVAGSAHLSGRRDEFRAQVPSWFPIDAGVVVAVSGVVEIALGLSLIHISEPTRQLASSRMPSSA